MSDEYLNKVRVGLRRSTLTTELEMELSDIVEQCLTDLIRIGVPELVVRDESNRLVLGCDRAYARWQFGIDGDNAERNHEEYIEMADNLRKGCR